MPCKKLAFRPGGCGRSPHLPEALIAIVAAETSGNHIIRIVLK
jgi:hypothetical protein